MRMKAAMMNLVLFHTGRRVCAIALSTGGARKTSSNLVMSKLLMYLISQSLTFGSANSVYSSIMSSMSHPATCRMMAVALPVRCCIILACVLLRMLGMTTYFAMVAVQQDRMILDI